MPHMARRPLDEIAGLWKFSAKTDDFSCDESETEPEITRLHLQRLNRSSVNNFSANDLQRIDF